MLRGTRGPGRLRNRFGPADYVLPATRAWIRERGWWPVTVVAPIAATDDACYLCAKPADAGQLAGAGAASGRYVRVRDAKTRSKMANLARKTGPLAAR